VKSVALVPVIVIPEIVSEAEPVFLSVTVLPVLVVPIATVPKLRAWKRQNAREKGYTPSTATTPVPGRSGATQIRSKRAFPIKLKTGLTSSRMRTDLRRPRFISVQAQLNTFSCQCVGPRPMRNSKPESGLSGLRFNFLAKLFRHHAHVSLFSAG
jgi:hypothetical protein